MKRAKLLGVLCLTASSGLASASVIPLGLQANVSQNTVNSWGWTECHRSSTTQSTSIQGMMTACQGDYLMMGVWDASLGSYGILGAGEYSTVALITYADYAGDNNGTTLNNWSNGLNFYRTGGYGSWGFTTNTLTELNSADILLSNGLQSQNGQAEQTLSAGLSFHIDGSALTSGWAYNPTGSNFTSIYDAGDQRVFFVTNATVPEPSILALVGLGLLGLGVSRRLTSGRSA